MNAHDIAKCVENIEPQDRMSKAELDRELVLLLAKALTKREKGKVLDALHDDLNFFRRESAPGSRVWYPHKLQVANHAHDVLGL